MAMETDDPRVALGNKSIQIRCAACRDLSRVGTLADVPLLVDKAGRDKSPAVRLCAAGAAADILSRHRLGPAREALTPDARSELLRSFSKVDPGVNAGLFPMLACLDHPQSFARIAAGLRDPRGDVRVGAGVGLLRLCVSGARLGDLKLESDLLNLLEDRRLKPDAVVEVAKVCLAGGYSSALPRLARISVGEGAHGETLALLEEALRSLSAPPAGIWWSDGRDAGEVCEEAPLAEAVRVFCADGSSLVWDEASRVWSLVPFAGAERAMRFRRVGAAASAPALQDAERTWYEAELDALEGRFSQALEVPDLDWSQCETLPHAGALWAAVEPMLGTAASDDRLRGILLHRAGQAEDARAALESAVAKKKVPPDTWFLLGEARLAAGDEDGARRGWEAAVKKARRKKDWQVERARARLG